MSKLFLQAFGWPTVPLLHQVRRVAEMLWGSCGIPGIPVTHIGLLVVAMAAPSIWRSIILHMVDSRLRNRWFNVSILVLTLGYWVWESRASGHIRVDLLLIYPVLFYAYILFLWDRLKGISIIASVLLMAVNYGFFVMSYSWFHKYPG